MMYDTPFWGLFSSNKPFSLQKADSYVFPLSIRSIGNKATNNSGTLQAKSPRVKTWVKI